MAEQGPQVQGIPPPPPPPAQAQAGQQVLQQQEQHAPPTLQGQQVIHLNWSYFKPEFSGKPDEDVEAICFILMICPLSAFACLYETFTPDTMCCFLP